MVGISLVLLKRTREIHKYYKDMPSQRSESCGPYSLAPILLAYGFKTHNGYEIDEDYLSMLARTRLMKYEAEERERVLRAVEEGKLSLGEAQQKYHKILYKYELPYTDKEVESGTSVQGLIHAVKEVCQGKLKTIPIASRKGRRIFFSKRRFSRLVRTLINLARDTDFQIILNLRTTHLIDPTSPEYGFMPLLLSWAEPESFRLWNWAVGHFTGVAGFLIFMDGGKRAIYFILRDTYKHYGFNGYHLQPMEHVRRALIRGDGREGGILLIVPEENYEKVRNAIESIDGLVISDWDNGSLF